MKHAHDNVTNCETPSKTRINAMSQINDSSGKYKDFPGGTVVKNPPVNAENVGSILGLGRSPGEGNGNPFQCSCLEIPGTEEPGGLQCMGLQKVQHN